jgi:hypothetical protein
MRWPNGRRTTNPENGERLSNDHHNVLYSILKVAHSENTSPLQEWKIFASIWFDIPRNITNIYLDRANYEPQVLVK